MVEMQDNIQKVDEKARRQFNVFALIFAIVIGGSAIIFGIYLLLGFGFGLIPPDPSITFL